MGQEIRQGSSSSVPWTNSPQVPGNATRTARCAGGSGRAISLVCRCMSRVCLTVLCNQKRSQGVRRATTVFRSVSARYYGPCYGVSTQIRMPSGYHHDSLSHIVTLQNSPDHILKRWPAFSTRHFRPPAWGPKVGVVAAAGWAAHAALGLITAHASPLAGLCHGHGNVRMAPIGRTSGSIAPHVVPTAAPATKRLGAAVTPGACSTAPCSISGALPRSSGPSNGVTMGRRASKWSCPSASRRAPGPGSACTPGVGGWHCGERSSRAVSLGQLHGTQEAERVCRSVALAVFSRSPAGPLLWP